ncbi:MAG: hypothetical protein F4Z16_06640 [Rhodothermaceae bacterium]|nr:hypothetical protein [Rhodothermaceae bacterium]MYD66838.1 hypothetical protein [Rhodothermaceae bacterium]MYI78164.1 hypothetical protein [Gammaproteobacteria bacterium]
MNHCKTISFSTATRSDWSREFVHAMVGARAGDIVWIQATGADGSDQSHWGLLVEDLGYKNAWKFRSLSLEELSAELQQRIQGDDEEAKKMFMSLLEAEPVQ